jgi:GxxExxY protein
MPGTGVSSGPPYEGPTGFSRARRIENLVAVTETAPSAHELLLRDIPCEKEYNTQLLYKKHEFGIIRVDLVIGGNLVVELKAVKKVTGGHRKQARVYLVLKGLANGILINFPTSRDEIDIFDEVFDETAL